MSEYIIEIPDEYFASYDAERDMYYPDERDSAMRITPIVRCRDCKYFTTNIHGSYCTKSITTLYSPDGFCAWGERRERESAEVWNQWSADDVTCSEES